MRLLLIEDDPSCSSDVELIFRSEDFVCHTTASGTEGVLMATRVGYDIIVLDLVLPDLDGYEVLRRIKSAGIEAPVLVLSALFERSDRNKAIEFGADDFVTKPFKKKVLVDRVRASVKRTEAQRARFGGTRRDPAPTTAQTRH